MAQTVGSNIARMAREAGAKLLPGIFSEDKGEGAPKTGGAKASQVLHHRVGVAKGSQVQSRRPKTNGATAIHVCTWDSACMF